jgi:DNA-binding response OmpR family regulator
MIVEDDTVIRESLVDVIRKWNYEAICVEDFSDIINIFSRELPHVILLDINLPCFDGFYWCNKIREVSKVPILFISSRNNNMDIIMAINMGGDDFIQKPFSIDVVMAKINGIMRRTYSYSNVQTDILEYNGVILNLGDNNVIYKEHKIELTKNEFRILYSLMRENGKIVSRDKLMRYLWEHESFVDDGTLTVNINRLRNKLEDIGLVDLIVTKKGQGYMVS